MFGILKEVYNRIYHAIDPIGYAMSLGVKLGKDCRLFSVDFGSEPFLVTLGDHVSATRTQFITHDGAVWVFRDKHPNVDRVAPIKVGNNVFLGFGAIILPGVTIGDNVIIGAATLVTKDIPSNTVYAGVPAKFIKTLDAYWDSVKDSVVLTKQMNRKEKKEYLLKRFSAE
jgi:acetyltransferase-like isoleucine patch superfamily enzyme